MVDLDGFANAQDSYSRLAAWSSIRHHATATWPLLGRDGASSNCRRAMEVMTEPPRKYWLAQKAAHRI